MILLHNNGGQAHMHLLTAHTHTHTSINTSVRSISLAVAHLAVALLLGFLAFVVWASPGVSPGLTLDQVQVRQEGCQGALDLVRLTTQGVLGRAVVRAFAVETDVIGWERARGCIEILRGSPLFHYSFFFIVYLWYLSLNKLINCLAAPPCGDRRYFICAHA